MCCSTTIAQQPISSITPTVFISYTSDQGSAALSLATRLRTDGVAANIDRWLVQPGDRLAEVGCRAIRHSDFVIMMLSRQYLEQLLRGEGTTFAEFDLAYQLAANDGKPRVIPMAMDSAAMNSLVTDEPELPVPPILKDRYILNASDNHREAVYAKLLSTLLGHTNAPPVSTLSTDPNTNLPKANLDTKVLITTTIDLDHFRGTECLHIELSPPAPDQGQWTLLLGENGVGKSSILWAITMALGGDQLIQGILSSLSAELVHAAENTAHIGINTSLKPFECTLRREGRRTYLVTATPAPALPLFAYGAARGSALGGSSRAVELKRPIDDVGTLFNVGSHLIHAETWLRSLEHGALKGSATAAATFDAVRQVLLTLLPGVDDIEITTDDIRVSGALVGQCTLASLSDGYLTTIGWVLDMIARWSHFARRHGLEIPSNFNKHMTGIVLIDELD